jgi:hypothetical protein
VGEIETVWSCACCLYKRLALLYHPDKQRGASADQVGLYHPDKQRRASADQVGLYHPDKQRGASAGQ